MKIQEYADATLFFGILVGSIILASLSGISFITGELPSSVSMSENMVKFGASIFALLFSSHQVSELLFR